jgi:hypothetical protein
MRQWHDKKTPLCDIYLNSISNTAHSYYARSAGIRNGFHEKPYVMYSDNAIFRAADQFAAGCEVFDDQTAVVLKVK